MVMDIRLAGVNCDTALELPGGFGKPALLLEQHAELIVALPLIAFECDRPAKKHLGLRLVPARYRQTLGVDELRERIARIRGRPAAESLDDLRRAIAGLVEHL